MSAAGIDWVSRSEALTLRVRNFIAGRWCEVGGARGPNKYSPRDGRLLSSVNVGVAEDAEEAIASARQAFEDGRWSRIPVQRRKDVLCKLAELLDKHHEELALLECLDTGKPISDAFDFDVPTAAASIRFSAEAADKLYGKVYATDGSNLSYELRRPMGVVVAIVGWNFPLYQAAQKLGPALATGNSLVLKPSELTSFSASRVAELALEAGVPEGVLNVIHGDGGLGSTLAHHRDVDILTFTGSTQTGKKLLVAAGESNMKRLILECGGKAPNIVFDDCSALEGVADAVLASAFWNQGQVCVASTRILVQRGVMEEFLKLLVRKASALAPRDPLDPGTRFGALVSGAHQRKVEEYIRAGIAEGAHLAYQTPFTAPFEGGFYMAPALFDGVSPRHTIAREEIFGPVLSVMSFATEEEAIRLANGTRYGLSAIVWTRDLGRAQRMSLAVDAGWIVVNATDNPQGGPGEGVLSVGGHKQSGIGTEGGLEGLEAYMKKSAVQFFV